eukprot:12652679-Alexandrium_andersonii.AAC.1
MDTQPPPATSLVLRRATTGRDSAVDGEGTAEGAGARRPAQEHSHGREGEAGRGGHERQPQAARWRPARRLRATTRHASASSISGAVHSRWRWRRAT